MFQRHRTCTLQTQAETQPTQELAERVAEKESDMEDNLNKLSLAESIGKICSEYKSRAWSDRACVVCARPFGSDAEIRQFCDKQVSSCPLLHACRQSA